MSDKLPDENGCWYCGGPVQPGKELWSDVYCSVSCADTEVVDIMEREFNDDYSLST